MDTFLHKIRGFGSYTKQTYDKQKKIKVERECNFVCLKCFNDNSLPIYQAYMIFGEFLKYKKLPKSSNFNYRKPP